MDYDDGQNNAWLRTHSISILQDAAHTFPEGRACLEAHDFSSLNEYAISIPYEGVQDPLPDEEEVLLQIKETVASMMQFIELDSGASIPIYQPPGPRR